ncbi:MAG: nucleotide exchange factor GrpE [Oscillospiraceae bacterium]|nr:nucleotide exchange factor GrpE [Oscillospiraceae bacterium]
MGKTNKDKSQDTKHKAKAEETSAAQAEENVQDTKHKAHKKDSANEKDTTFTEQDVSDSEPTDNSNNSADLEGDAPETKMQNELTAERDRYMRLAAEYDNFRKRSKLERESTYQQARVDAITRLLPVYDNLERALKMACSDEAFYKGIEMTMTGLTDALDGMDVKPIVAVGEPFDPNRHNAVMAVENPDLGEKIVAEEFQKGFMLGDKVIRFSTVVVAN